jgi:hypothetical protein
VVGIGPIVNARLLGCCEFLDTFRVSALGFRGLSFGIPIALPQDMTNQAKAVQMVAALYEAISGIPEGIPSGHLYAAVMGTVDLTTYEQLIGVMVRSGLITRSNHVLKACPLGK